MTNWNHDVVESYENPAIYLIYYQYQKNMFFVLKKKSLKEKEVFFRNYG